MLKSQKNLKQDIANDKRSAIRHEEGVVVGASPQGDRLFLMVRKRSYVEYVGNSPRLKDGPLFGNKANIPEDQLTLAEVLIESDIDLSRPGLEPAHYIGQLVTVEIIDGLPIRVITTKTLSSPRVIPPNDIAVARSLSRTHSLKDSRPIEYLKSKGHSKEVIDAIIEETVSGSRVEGNVVLYGNISEWNRSIKPNGTDGKDLVDSLNKGIVTHLPTSELKDKPCHKPAKALSAK